MSILAYIDPGSGSLLLQALLAGLLSAPFFFRRTIGDVWHRMRRGKSDAGAANAANAAERPDR